MALNLQHLGPLPACAVAMLLHLPAAGWAASPAGPPCTENWTEQRAVSVQDARSVTLEDGSVLRLVGIEPFGALLPPKEASDAALIERLAAIVNLGPLQVAVLEGKPDRYGRLPALLATRAGELVQAVAVREGLAIAFPTDDPLPCFNEILAVEELARRERRGFWSEARVLPARPEAVRARTGGLAVFEGIAASVGNRPYRTYLNFGGRWSEDVTVAIEPRYRDRFGGEAELAKLAGRRLRVRGFVEESGGPMVVARSPLQIEILGAGADGEMP